jgi:hypothetical protein
VVVEAEPEALLVGLPEEGGTAVITKIAKTKTLVIAKTRPKRLSEGDDPVVILQVQRIPERLLDTNVNSKLLNILGHLNANKSGQ